LIEAGSWLIRDRCCFDDGWRVCCGAHRLSSYTASSWSSQSMYLIPSALQDAKGVPIYSAGYHLEVWLHTQTVLHRESSDGQVQLEEFAKIVSSRRF
jgi:uncharacterized protein (DUF779 family)